MHLKGLVRHRNSQMGFFQLSLFNVDAKVEPAKLQSRMQPLLKPQLVFFYAFAFLFRDLETLV